MRIDFLCNDGSPLGVSMNTLMGADPAQIGVGGAELAMLTLCEEWSKRGDQVRLYNDPRPNWQSPFEQLPIGTFNPQEDRDILIIYRSPNLRAVGAKGLKVWFSTDQFSVGNYAQFRQMVDKVVCISEYHSNYFKANYQINDAIVIDLPVRVHDYENKNIEKIKNRFIFTSVPARGLDVMLEIWPRIVKEVPDATLVITSDYRLWGHSLGMGNEQFISKARGLENITFLSAVPRTRLIEEQLKAEINMYPCIYDELFCIAIAEAQVAGAYTITSDCGALATTNMGTLIRGDARQLKDNYVSEAVQFIKNRYVHELRSQAIKRFHPDTILEKWDKKVFNG